MKTTTKSIGELTRRINYFALPDPSNPDVMTFWRRDRKERGRSKGGGNYFNSWPGRKTYGPVVPPELEANPLTWAVTECWPWMKRRDAAVEADPAGCAARFHVLTGRCCVCGKPSDTGICTECQKKVPAEAVQLISDAIIKQQQERS